MPVFAEGAESVFVNSNARGRAPTLPIGVGAGRAHAIQRALRASPMAIPIRQERFFRVASHVMRHPRARLGSATAVTKKRDTPKTEHDEVPHVNMHQNSRETRGSRLRKRVGKWRLLQ